MPSLTYPRCIRRLYESEANGEAIYSALLAVAQSDRDRYHFATLLQLESETKAWLQPFLFKHHVELTTPDMRQFIEGATGLYREKGWKGLMLSSQPIIAAFLADFEEIAAIGPAGDTPYLVGMVEHEKAIQKWAAAELAGAGDSSLQPIISLLRHPIARPLEG